MLSQAQDHIQRFLSASSAERSSVLVLTNTALARSLSIRPIPTSKATLVRVVHYDAPEGRKNAAARERIAKGVFGGQGAGKAEEVHIESGEDAMGLTPFVFESAAFGVIRSRCVASCMSFCKRWVCAFHLTPLWPAQQPPMYPPPPPYRSVPIGRFRRRRVPVKLCFRTKIPPHVLRTQ